MAASNLADLDELVLRCRSDESRRYIAEAVACYNAGAYRACIITTWLAVFWDFLNKLRELEISGDEQAARKLEEFQNIQKAGENQLKNALEYERNILDVAKNNFELLTDLEYTSLKRIQEDRHRCAHPSMLSIDEPYRPTAELARSHMRNAVEILLEREPVQGKAAFERVMRDINDKYFPIEVREARDLLESGPLKRARKSLVKNIVTKLSEGFLLDNTKEANDSKRRMITAIGAILEMHREIVEEVIDGKVKNILKRLDHNFLSRALAYIRYIPVTWELIDITFQNKLVRYLASVPKDKLYVPFVWSFNIPALKDKAMFRVKDLSDEDFVNAIRWIDPTSELNSEIIKRFVKANSYNSASSLGNGALTPFAYLFTAEEVAQVLNGIRNNSQLWGCDIEMPNILESFLEATKHVYNEISTDWNKLLDFLIENHLESSYIVIFKKLRPKVAEALYDLSYSSATEFLENEEDIFEESAEAAP